MLPSPFFTEVPVDLGDDRTWADEATGDNRMEALTHRAWTNRRAIVDDWIAAGALTLVSWVRRALAP